MAILLGTMDAESTGRIAGSLLPILILLWGASKCHIISQRPGTNRKCALALMYALLALVVSYALGASGRYFINTPYYRTINILTFMVFMGMAIIALILGIRGLREYSKQPGQYQQGRKQAGWALAVSSILLLLATSGFVRGYFKNKNGTFKPVAGVPGKMQEFPDYNFRYKAPEHPWVAVDVSGINKDSKAAFMRRTPETYFIIIPEVLASQMSSQQLAEFGKAHLKSAATSAHIIQEMPFKVNNYDGVLVESEAQVGKLQLFYVQWYMATNGYAYQLMGYGKTTDRKQIEDELKQMLPRFEVIDPNRIAFNKSASFSTNFISSAHYYTVEVVNSAWHKFSSLKEDFPEAEFGGSQGDSCFAILPVWLGGQNIDIDTLATSLLSEMNITYPGDDFIHRQELNEEGESQLQFDFKRTIKDTIYRYRFRIIHRGEFAYLMAAWTVRNEENADEVLNDALKRINVSAPKLVTLKTRLAFSAQDKINQGYILNNVGLRHFKSEEYEKALPLFKAAIAADTTNTDPINNVLLTWSRMGRYKEALDFLDQQPKGLQDKPEFIAFKAYLQMRSSLNDEALANYAKAFATDYRDEADFKDYINLLIETRQYDTALTEVRKFLQVGDVLNIRLLIADIYHGKQDYNQAVSFLKAEHDKAPYNAKITRQLIYALLDANQPNEALVYSREYLSDNKDSYLAYYLQALSQIKLKWYRDAKASLEAAAKLEPSNNDVISELNYVSGMLGEGNNSMLKYPIDPVLLPESLTNDAIVTLPKDIASDFGAYYKQRVKALLYNTNSQYKITDYLLIHVLDAVGVAEFSTYQMTFDPLSEDIYVNEARVLDGSGNTIKTVPLSDCYVIDETQSGKVSQRKTLNIPISGLKPGCDVSLAITRRSAGNQDEFPFLSHCFSRAFPTLKSGVFLQGNDTGLKVRTTPGIQRENLKDGIYWSITNPMVARWEPLQPPSDTFLPMLWIADGDSRWERMASNYLASITDRLQPDEGVKLKSLQLVNGLKDDSEKVAALSRFVQTNCTYKAIEFGRHSRTPKNAAETLRNAYGDCKDQAVLLQQLLKFAGLPANLTLISCYDSVQPDLPSMDQFDHMIVEVKQNNQEWFIDPTEKGSDLASGLPVGLSGHQALVLDPLKPYLTKLADYPNDASIVKFQQYARLVGTNNLSVDETITLTGVCGAYMRDYLLTISTAYRQEAMQREMGLADAAISRFEIEALDRPREPLQIKSSFVLKNRFHQTPNGLSGTLSGGFARYYLTTTPATKRVTPFKINVPLQIQGQIVFDLPKNYHVNSQSLLPVKLDSRFLNFNSKELVDAGKLSFALKLQQWAGLYDFMDYSVYRETMDQVCSSLEHQIDLQLN